MKSKRMELRRKREERRRRYKKNYQGVFLSLKIACICYLAIFGTSYMSSGTSAFFSNQHTVPSMITAGTWNYCGEEDEIDSVLGEETNFDSEDSADILTEENEQNIGTSDEIEVDCEEETTSVDVDCNENDSKEELDAKSSEETKTECRNNKIDSNDESEKNNTTEATEATKKQEVGDENAEKNQVQPVNKDTMPVTESTETKPDKDSVENKGSEVETNAAINGEIEKEKVEGDLNEREKEQEEDKSNEVGE